MTARTSEKLAQVLHSAGLFDLEKRARADEFHDYLSPHATPQLILAGLLIRIIKSDAPERERIAAKNIRQRLIDGEFDASEEESDEWAKSAEGQDTFNKLMKGK